MESSSHRDTVADDGRVAAAALRQRKSEMARIERARARAGADAFEAALREAREEFMGQLRARYDARRRRMDAQTTTTATTAHTSAPRARDARISPATTPGSGGTGAALRRRFDVGSRASFALGSTLDDVRRRPRRDEHDDDEDDASVSASPSSTPSSAMRARETSSGSAREASPRLRGAPVFASPRASPSPRRRHPQSRYATPHDDTDARDLLESVADMVRRAESLRAQLSPSRFRDY